jgi:hypothetical protein
MLPERTGGGPGPLLHHAGGLHRQPQAAVHGEQQDEEDPPGEAVRVEQRQDAALHYPLAVQRQAHEDVGERDAKEQGGQEAAGDDAPVPDPAPGCALDKAAELHGNPADDEAEEQQHERGVQGAEHDRVGPWKGGEGHPARGDQPDLVAVPERPHGRDHRSPLLLVAGQEGHHGAQAQVEPARDEVGRPKDSPEQKPDCLEHRTPSLGSAVRRPPGPCG